MTSPVLDPFQLHGRLAGPPAAVSDSAPAPAGGSGDGGGSGSGGGGRSVEEWLSGGSDGNYSGFFLSLANRLKHSSRLITRKITPIYLAPHANLLNFCQ